MSVVVRVGLGLLLFAAGVGCGAYFGFRLTEIKAQASEMAQIAHYSVYLDAQRTQGSDAAYEEALRGFLDLLDTHSQGSSPLFSEKVYAVDSALTYARLSVLASKRGASDEAATYIGEALALCPELGWQDCSAKTLTEAVLRLDKRGPFGSANAP